MPNPTHQKSVVPAKAGTHDHRLWNMGPRNGAPTTQASRGTPRGDDGWRAWMDLNYPIACAMAATAGAISSAA
jgi:hypothetical protein